MNEKLYHADMKGRIICKVCGIVLFEIVEQGEKMHPFHNRANVLIHICSMCLTNIDPNFNY